jgi:CubicO group peptidase (beta-lactamase class C family)
MKQIKGSGREPLIFLSIFLLFLVFVLVTARDEKIIREVPKTQPDFLVSENKTKQNLDQLIPKLMAQVDIPGLAISVIKNSKIIWTKGFGKASGESNFKVDENTIFEAGSLSKPVFAYGVSKLAVSGKMDLDKPLTEYMPVFHITDQKVNKITARMILSHSSGFPLWWPEGKELKIHFTPGERFSYSSEGFVFLQQAVEQITGERINVFMEENVFKPLGMTNSSYTWRADFENHVALGHDIFGIAQEPWKRTQGNAAASLYTTAIDYAKFMVAVLSGNGLKQNTYKEMLKPHISVNPDCIECLDQDSTERSDFLYWGLGWGLEKTTKGLAFWHWGDNIIFTSYAIGLPETNSAVVYFTNSSNGLSLRDEIIRLTIGGGNYPAFKWIKYDQHDSPAMTFRQTVLKKGTGPGFRVYHEMKLARGLDSGLIPEQTINEIGYMLLQLNRDDEAIEIFRFNIEEYPDSWNVYDSLAEVYANTGDKQRAINYYSIALDKVAEKDHKNRILKIINYLQN